MTTLDKSFLVLETLAELGPRVPLGTLQKATLLPKATLYRLLRTMVDRGLVRYDTAGRYSIGPQVYRMAGAVYARWAPPPGARAVMVELQRTAPETVHVSSFRHGQLMYVEKLDAPHPYQMSSRVGMAQCLHSSAIGKAILAEIPAERAEVLLGQEALRPVTELTIVDPVRLLSELPAIHAAGYAIDDEEDEEGLRAIGAAFCDDSGTPAGGVSIVAPSFRMSLAQARGYAPALVHAAQQIGEMFVGATPPQGLASNLT
ncbi:IclR family transcriptional regulator [Mycolicibacterium sp. YH-1]|uniref:IclR family transcriptional regulator n=1 Tax=Mycolicibacterium sp. YH-1 TaxID=2908837 RepID=UPI001F4C311D|nr:IclR family transcriptional regulator [Mycolicibacterium sp. YH-1]UNB52058.1 IclR family transcriptional regulator [Mycolicibacterium sp. YH-1]